MMVAAAFAAGVINAIAGGGTLITFPVLIWLGLDPKVANATSTVALWPGLFGGLFGYRRELENSSTILLRLGTTSVIGGGTETDANAAAQELGRYLVEQAWFVPWYRPESNWAVDPKTTVEIQANNAYPYLWNFKPRS